MENQTEEVTEEQITDLQLAKQDAGTVEILKQEVIDDLKEKLELVKSFKRKYTLKKLAISDIENKEQKEKLRLALADLRSTRTGLKDDRIAKTKPYRDTVAYINESFDAVIDAIEKMEAPLIEHNKQVKLEIERRAKEEEERKKKLVIDRVKKCQDAGMVFDGEYYSIGSEEFGVEQMSLGMVEFETMTDGIFENIFLQIEEKAKIIADASEVKKKQLAAEKLQKEEEERKAKQKLLDDQAELAAKQKELDNQALLQQQRAATLAAKMLKIRLTELATLGIEYIPAPVNEFRYKGALIFNINISTINDEEWDVLIEKTFPLFIKQKYAMAEAQKEFFDAQKENAAAAIAQKEPLDVVEQKPVRVWDADNENFNKYKAAIIMIEYPSLHTELYINFLTQVKKKITEIIAINA